MEQNEQVLKLSDAYLAKTDFPMLELTVKATNINLPNGHALLTRCRPLYEYSWFIQRIKEYMASGMNRDDSIIASIKDCEREGIMVDFVRAYGTEAVNMLFTEFNMEDALEVRYEEGFEDGMEKGELVKLIQQVCRKLQKGKTSEAITSELEEDALLIDKICTAIEKSDPEAAPEQIYKTFLTME